MPRNRMRGEETGRRCRHEASGRPAKPSLELSIRQVDGVNAVLREEICYAFASGWFTAEFFKRSPTVSSISRERASSDTARASAIAPTSALKIKIALDLAARLSLSGSIVAIT